MPKAINISGKRYGKLIVTNNYESGKYGRQWECLCDCGNITHQYCSTLNYGKVKSCGCLVNSFKIANNTVLPYRFWQKFLLTSKRRKITVDITPEYIMKIYNQQKGVCALSNIDITFPKNSKQTRFSQYTASIDRIDSSKDYVVGNIQIVHKKINMMKQNYSQDEFIHYCKLVASNN